MIASRLLFGMGTEAGYVVRNNATLDYFGDAVGGPFVGIALALTLVGGRIGSLITFSATERVVSRQGGDFMAALWFGIYFCIASIVLAAVFLALDVGAEAARGSRIKQESGARGAELLADDAVEVADDDDGAMVLASDTLLHRNSGRADAGETPLDDEAPATEEDSILASKRMSMTRRLPTVVQSAIGHLAAMLRDIASFDRSFWLLVGIVMVYYGVICAFLAVSA